MRKAEAEALVRRVVHDWAAEIGFKVESDEMPSFSAFKAWLREQYGDVCSFRSTMGADFDCEMWFDDELKQNWRN
ncbi:MAG TPA: hypothetical protein PLL33_11210 [Paracoccus sp. (in: a-proteobacteria)]|nr:hypothetical protein [Paracoccus sp. (in: a-proteobacteria)]